MSSGTPAFALDATGVAQGLDLGGDVIAAVGDDAFEHLDPVFEPLDVRRILRGFFGALSAVAAIRFSSAFSGA